MTSKNQSFLLESLLLNRHWWLVIILLWSVLVAISFFTTVDSIKHQSYLVAKESARNMFNMVVLTRRWNAKHGGVYVPIIDTVGPNPYLEVEHRDITAEESAQKLTLINPAFMTRQLSELAEKQQSGTRFHITSLNPIRPANKADDWEVNALSTFELGNKEVAERITGDTGDIFRFMAPLVTQKACLKCHARQGYKVGDIRGGISITLNSEPIFGKDDTLIQRSLTNHIIVFLLVSGLFLFFFVQLRRKWLHLKHVQEHQLDIIRERTASLENRFIEASRA